MRSCELRTDAHYILTLCLQLSLSTAYIPDFIGAVLHDAKTCLGGASEVISYYFLRGETSIRHLWRISYPPYMAPHMYVHFTSYQEPWSAYGETGFGLTGRSGLDV